MPDFPPIIVDYKKYLSEVWMYEPSFTERWEQGFRKHLYHGRTLAFYKSDSIAKTPYGNLTLPEIVDADSGLESAPWNNVLRMRNSKDGVAVDELYVGYGVSFKKVAMCFEAKLPTTVAGTP